MGEKIVLVGGGGHARVIVDAIALAGDYEVYGYVAPAESRELLNDGKYLGDDNELKKLFQQGIRNAICAIGSVGLTEKRHRVIDYLKAIGFNFVNVIHPQAVLARGARIGKGVFIAAGVVINPDTVIADHVVLNTGAIVEHNCLIGENAQIAPGAILGGGVVIGEDSFIGMGARVIQGIKIGGKCLIGAGAVVIHDIEDGQKVVGVPAKRLMER